MANFSDKAEEVVGRAKQAAGDLTDNDELRAEGTADKTRAQVKQGVDAAVDKAEEVASEVKEGVSDTVEKASDKASELTDKASELTDKASEQASVVADKAVDTAQQLHLDDKRVLIVAAIAGVTLTLLVRKFRGDRHDNRATAKRVTKRAAKRATKRAAKTGLGRALAN